MSIEKLEVPKFGYEEEIGGHVATIMESKESVIIELVEKVNELIEHYNYPVKNKE